MPRASSSIFAAPSRVTLDRDNKNDWLIAAAPKSALRKASADVVDPEQAGD